MRRSFQTFTLVLAVAAPLATAASSSAYWADLAAQHRQHPLDDAALAKRAKNAALYAEGSDVRESAADLLGVLAGTGSAKRATEGMVDVLLESEDGRVVAAALASAALAREAAFLRLAGELRKMVLEGQGPHHRERARRVLLWLLTLRDESAVARGGAFERLAMHPDDCVDGLDPEAAFTDVCARVSKSGGEAAPPADPAAFASARRLSLYSLATEGAPGATALLDALTSTRTESPGAESARLYAANSLALTGVEPTAAMVDQVVAAQRDEADRLTRIEELLAFAAFAERSQDAFGRFKSLLEAEPDCGVAEAVALSLPSHDLRMKLFKRLAGVVSGRAAQLRTWVRSAPPWQLCR